MTFSRVCVIHFRSFRPLGLRRGKCWKETNTGDDLKKKDGVFIHFSLHPSFPFLPLCVCVCFYRTLRSETDPPQEMLIDSDP